MLGCWVTVLQCCTGSLSWLLDTRPCLSHTNLSNVPPLCTSTAGPHSCCAVYQPPWLLGVYVCSSLPKHISIIPSQTPRVGGGHLEITMEEEDPGSCLRPPLRLQSPASPPRHPTPSCQDSRHSHSQPSLKDARLWQIKPI